MAANHPNERSYEYPPNFDGLANRQLTIKAEKTKREVKRIFMLNWNDPEARLINRYRKLVGDPNREFTYDTKKRGKPRHQKERAQFIRYICCSEHPNILGMKDMHMTPSLWFLEKNCDSDSDLYDVTSTTFCDFYGKSVIRIQNAVSMTVTNRGHVVIATKTQLLKYDLAKNGGERFNRQHGDMAFQYKAVTCQGNTLVALVSVEDISIEQYDTGLQPVGELIHTELAADPDFDITCAMASDTNSLFICSFFQDCIYRVHKDTGEILQEYGSRGDQPGQLDSPYICCSDGRTLLIADCYNNRLQTLDTTPGVPQPWNILNIHPPGVLRRPKAAVLWPNGTIFVAGGIDTENPEDVEDTGNTGNTGNNLAGIDTEKKKVKKLEFYWIRRRVDE